MKRNCFSGAMVSVLASGTVDCGFEPRSSHTKDYKIGNCCYFTKHTALRRKSKNWLVSGYCVRVGQHVSLRTCFGEMVQGGPHHHFIES